ncbi:hypothetical protein TCAL_08874 [Tigriopus californicus]|uniref:C2H2-type domain-containing protein n=1 Tax=Tigriopus californicus TaxID=6832 RepID=A0A553N911_TIGCA|nr:hypothetical protein TCAL_08874 [Tigriopus californicus]|eukprot:TCALIF_08874-PA protein Name:"Protein of unknown function" AED:0.01 eAED:0.01 QI:162/0.75/0.6/1/1/1/5/0/368
MMTCCEKRPIVKMLFLYLLFLSPLDKFQFSFHNQATPKTCSRSQSAIVRQLIQKLWRPIFKRFAQKMPAQCPLHFGRDHFGPQELAKNEFRADLWMCKICGKPFQSHSHLDLHLAKFHGDSVFQADESVCLGDFCDIFRCHGYLPANLSALEDSTYLEEITDLEQYDAIYPDLKVPKPDIGMTELIPGPPETLLKLLKLQEKEKRSKEATKDEEDIGFFGSSFFQQGFSSSIFDSQTRQRKQGASQEAISKDLTPNKIRRKDTIQRSSRAQNVFKNIFMDEEESSASSKDGNGSQEQVDRLEEETLLEIWKIPDDPDEAHCDDTEMTHLKEKCESLLWTCTSPLTLALEDEKFQEFQGTVIRQYSLLY